MNERGAVVGLSLLCVLGLCTLAAPSALGAKLNTTAVTCKPVVKGAQFSDEHCTKGAEGGGFAHEVIPVKKLTKLSGTNEGTGGETKSAISAELRFEVSEIEFEVVCTGVSRVGTLENSEKENEKKEKEIVATVGKSATTYSGCTVVSPSKQKCKVAGEKFVINLISSSSYKKKMSLEMILSGSSITIEECETESLNGKFSFEGSYRAEPNGATLITTGAATALTFSVNKNPSELVSSVTLRARPEGSEGETIPLSFTTG